MRRSRMQKSHFCARKAAPSSAVLQSPCAGALPLRSRRRRTQLFLLSDPPRRCFVLDYDPGPLFCVHLLWSLDIFIIAPQKNGVNPKPWIYRNFISFRIFFYVCRPCRGSAFCRFAPRRCPDKTEHPSRCCGAPGRVFCLDIALV